MISPTFPEPLIDVAAQLRALYDPVHPKDAMWLSTGTGIPASIDGLISICAPGGVLLTTSVEKALRFSASPDEDTLCDILGYIEPKTHIIGMATVVHARDRDDAVILEMAVSDDRVGEAIAAAAPYGEIALTTVGDALERRARLLRMEVRT